MSGLHDAPLDCRDEQRRAPVRARPLNGLDYLEVSESQTTLTVFFLGKAPQDLKPENVRIDGGRRVRNLQVTGIELCTHDDEERDDCLRIFVDRPGDFSIYRLCLVEVDAEGHPTDQPFHGFDRRYFCLSFSFKAGCPSDLDCKVEAACPPEETVPPEINYLAKDYASFRQLLLDRLALTLPDWQERHAPDLGITLVEILAYAGDHLSYHQDAVATEAYLDTARLRISVRRHVRLVDYNIHEGTNARAFVTVETAGRLELAPAEFLFITGFPGAPARRGVLAEDDLADVPADRYLVFEPLVEDPGAKIVFLAAHNTMRFYTWGDAECCLPRGATRATLRDDGGLHLDAGDVLIFEEVIGPETGVAGDADSTHRHAVRLTRVEPDVDPLFDQAVVEIEWSAEDALPFPLCLSALGPAPGCLPFEDISVARGNVVLVDEGRTVEERLGSVPEGEISTCCEGPNDPADGAAAAVRFQAVLDQAPLVFRQAPFPALSAARLLAQDPRQALPQVSVVELSATPEASWEPCYDLLASGPADRHLAVEVDDDGHAHLRFGDGESGRRPEAGAAFRARYRIGGGPAGNVGAESIAFLVQRNPSGVTALPRNPLPAQGGTAREPVAEIKTLAPHAFRRELRRAITAEDYATLVTRHFKDRVQRAAATLRWTGSGDEVLVAVDALGGEEPAPELRAEIAEFLRRFRRIGHDLVVAPARLVSLDLGLTVCVRPDDIRGHVKAAVLELLSSRVLPDGRRGFFHPDNFTFGQGVAASRIVAAVQAVQGVESVVVTKLERLFAGANGELQRGFLPLSPLEVARLDNDPVFPENGVLRLEVGGGR